MDENWINFEKFEKDFNNTLVIDMDSVVILRGLVNGEDDYYWLLQKMTGEYYQSSCVGEVIPLKTYIYKEAYDRLKSVFKCNLDSLNQEIL